MKTILLGVGIFLLYLIYDANTQESFKSVNYTIEGDEIYQKHGDNHVEYSRFNYKTKECKHWYCKEMIKQVTNKKVLVLGVALGGIIINILDKYKNADVTGVDISDENFDLVKKYSDTKRLTLVEEDAKEYIKNTKKKFDIIICDVFINKYIPEFVLSKEFLNKINKMLLPNGKFLINTIDIDVKRLLFIMNQSFTNATIETKTNYLNNLVFVTKKN